MPMPPCLIYRGAIETKNQIMGKHGPENVRVAGYGAAADEEWASKESKAWWGAVQRAGSLGARARERVVTMVEMLLSVNITLDGGTWISITGVSLNTARNCFLDGLSKKEQAQPYELKWLQEGDCVLDYCARVRPGDPAFLALALHGLDARRQQALTLLTQKPARVLQEEAEEAAVDDAEDDVVDEQDEDEPPLNPNLQDDAQRQRQQQDVTEAARNVGQAAGAEAVTVWEDLDLRKMEPPFDPLTYVSPVKHSIDQLDNKIDVWFGNVQGIDAPLQRKVLVRLPIVPERMGSRDLPQAAWDSSSLDVISCAGICILHAAMRTGEATFRHVLSVCQGTAAMHRVF